MFIQSSVQVNIHPYYAVSDGAFQEHISDYTISSFNIWCLPCLVTLKLLGRKAEINHLFFFFCCFAFLSFIDFFWAKFSKKFKIMMIIIIITHNPLYVQIVCLDSHLQLIAGNCLSGIYSASPRLHFFVCTASLNHVLTALLGNSSKSRRLLWALSLLLCAARESVVIYLFIFHFPFLIEWAILSL